MSTQSAYRSRHPDVLAEFGAAQDRMRAYRDRIFTVTTEHGMGDHQIAVSSGALSPSRFQGVVTRGGEFVPDGWRVSAIGGRDLAVPDKRTKAGKAIAAAIKDAGSPGDCILPGMPREVIVTEDGYRVCSPGVRLLEDGGAVWVTWGMVLEAATAMDFHAPVSADPEFWEQSLLSAYWAAVEAADGKNKPVLARSDSRA